MKHCPDLYLLSAVACQLSDCLTPEELAALSADLMTLGDMLASILAHENLCRNDGGCPAIPE